jgi:hypothetical protein
MLKSKYFSISVAAVSCVISMSVYVYIVYCMIDNRKKLVTTCK